MAIGTKELAPTELDSFEDSRLTEELRKAKEELFNLRFQSATGQLESHGRLRAVKRDIARIYTVLRERELGIRATPELAAAAEPAPRRSRLRRAAAQPAESTTAGAPVSEAPSTEDATTEAPSTEESN